MSINNFAEFKYIKTFETDEEVRLGGFSLASGRSALLSSIRVFMFIKEYPDLTGNETLTMKLYTSLSYQNAYATSVAVNPSDIEFGTFDASKPNWLGYVSFTFAKEWLNASFNYYPTVTVANYTDNGDIFYIGLAYDYPDPVYDNGGADFFDQSIAMQIFTQEQRIV